MRTPAEKITGYLKENGIKQVFVSQKTGINDSTLSAKLKGQIRLSAEDIENICWAIGRSPADFLEARPPEIMESDSNKKHYKTIIERRLHHG